MVRHAFALLAGVTATNPLSKVIDLLDECTSKVSADGDAEAKAYKKYFAWCDETATNTKFEIETAQAQKAALLAKIDQLTASIQGSNSQIEELTSAIAKDESELADATSLRNKEAGDFAASEAELSDDIDTLDRAVAVLQREAAKNPAAFAQIDTTNAQKLVQALSVVVDAAAFSGTDKNRLTALIQSQQGTEDDDSDLGAPAAAAYKTHSSNILDVLADMKEKAEGQLSDLRKAEVSALHNYEMLRQSLEDSIKADNIDFNQEKSALAAATEGKAVATGDLAVTSKDLAASEAALKTASTTCMSVAADHEATVTARTEELAVIAEAKKVLQATTSGGETQAYGFMQISSRADLKNVEVVTVVRNLAKKQHSSALAQLASRIEAVAEFGATAGEDPFVKIKGLISNMITKLEKQAGADATEKQYCDEEMSKTEAKKADLEDTVSKLTAKAEQAAAASAKRKGEVRELQARLASLAKEQAEMDGIRAEGNANYRQAKKDLELALSGTQKALGILRDYFGGAALVQMGQPAKPETFSKSSGAGSSIISILEVVESDFATSLAKEETQEADAAADYEKVTQANKINKASMEQSVKYKSQEATSLDKDVNELASDKGTTVDELTAVDEYYSKLRERCVAKPETYEVRRARREAEISGLKEALDVLENETAFVQRKRRGLRGTLAADMSS